jgi:NAD(P)-dependent dehydrogenase (short-subunit alcohol dehydrogenase family)
MPWILRTRLADGIYDDPEFVSAASAFTPMGRIAAAHEIRGAAIFLASDASNFMTARRSSSTAVSSRPDPASWSESDCLNVRGALRLRSAAALNG